MMKCSVYEVNAFCHNGSGGNGAGVVLDQQHFSQKEKILIAHKMGYSETVFVTPGKIADYRLEYFTPAAEVDLCGHATIATFVLMQQQGLKHGTYTISTRSGILKVKLTENSEVFMQQCNPTFFDVYAPETFSYCLPTAYHRKDLPIQAVSTGLKDILFPVDTVDHLRAMKPDFKAMAELNRTQGVVGIHAFALTGDNTAECRNFAPLYDIEEESATGTSNCALACYLHNHLKTQGHYRFLQGVSMNCPSDIEVVIETSNSQISNVMVGGRGKVIGCRTLFLNS